MQLQTDSLNVAVASGIFLYHFCQRGGHTHTCRDGRRMTAFRRLTTRSGIMDIAVDRLMTLKVKDVMTRKVICVAQNQRLSEAAGLFLEKGISGAPVVDEQGRCVGVLERD